MIVPGPSPDTQPFWDAARAHRLELPRCATCWRWLHPQAAGCPCGADERAWSEASGRATLLSHTVVHRPPHPSLADEVPYTVTLVALEEGPQLVSGLRGAGHDLSVGQSLVVTFDDVEDDVTLVRFAPPAGRAEETHTGGDR
jgi:uncharacterized OB-fold protein